MSTLYIGIGSNVEPEKNLADCAAALRKAFENISFSSVYRCAARDVTDQDDFFNAAAKIETNDTPQEIQRVLKQIEEALQKDPPYDKGPRTIDLDILLYDEQIHMTEELTIPHPRMHERRFVLEPLCDVNDDAGLKKIMEKTLDQHCEKVEITL